MGDAHPQFELASALALPGPADVVVVPRPLLLLLLPRCEVGGGLVPYGGVRGDCDLSLKKIPDGHGRRAGTMTNKTGTWT